jgi:Skp family chaperone for outer membrane proteins
VKSKVGIIASLAALGVLGYMGSQLIAQNTAQPQGTGKPAMAPGAAPAVAPLQTHMAIFNLSYVIKNYKRFDTFQEDNKQLIKQYDDQLMKLKTTYDAKQASLKDTTKPLPESQRDQTVKEIKEIERHMQDLQEDGRQAVGKKEGEQFKILYKDIEAAVVAYARSHNIELVMHYNDVLEPADKYSPANISRKLGYGGFTPIYNDPRMDITQELVKMLNSALPSNNAVQPVSGTAPATPGTGSPAPSSYPH